MIILHNIDTTTMFDIQELLKHYVADVQYLFNKETEHFNIRIESSVPVIAKYWNIDSTVRLELGSKILDIKFYDYSEVTII